MNCKCGEKLTPQHFPDNGKRWLMFFEDTKLVKHKYMCLGCDKAIWITLGTFESFKVMK